MLSAVNMPSESSWDMAVLENAFQNAGYLLVRFHKLLYLISGSDGCRIFNKYHFSVSLYILVQG
jgi:hypothetical protein